MSYSLDKAIKGLNLIEAFSDSVPSWLRKRLKYDAGSNKRDTSLRAAQMPARYSGPREIFSLLRRAGYDLTKMKVVEAPLPQNMDDAIFDDYTKLPILHIVTKTDDQVFIPGLNDEFKYTDDDGKEKSFKYFNNAQFKKYAKDFAYIDLSEKDTHYDDLDRPKSNLNDYSGDKDISAGENPNVRYSKDQMKNNYWARQMANRGVQYYDKSGYFRGGGTVTPGDRSGLISNRLRDKLKEFKRSRLPQKYLELEKVILDLQDDLNSKESILKNTSSSLRDFKNINNEVTTDRYILGNIIDNYLRYGNYLQPDGTFRGVSDFSDLESDIRKFKDRMKEYATSSFVW